jgi:hypothetical protein
VTAALVLYYLTHKKASQGARNGKKGTRRHSSRELATKQAVERLALCRLWVSQGSD